MLRLIKYWITPPIFDDEDLTYQVYPLYVIVTLTLALNVLNIVGALFITNSNRLSISVMLVFFQLAAIYLLRRRFVKTTGFILVSIIWITINYASSLNNGILSPVFSICSFCIIVATLTIGERAGLGFCALSIISGAVFVSAAQSGAYPKTFGELSVTRVWSNYAGSFIAIFFVITLSTRTVKSALNRARQSEAKLLDKNRQLEGEIEIREHLLKALEESENRWRFALEGSGDGVWDWNVQTQQAYRSRRYGELVGLDEDDKLVSITDWSSRIHPDDVERVTKTFDDYLADKIPTYEVEYRLRHTDGAYRWFLSRGKIISRAPDGSPVRVVGTTSDISSRKQMEENLRASESAYRHMFEDNPNPMWVFDMDSLAFLAVNDAAVDHYGYSRDEFLNMTIKDIRPDDEHDRLQQYLRQKRIFFKANSWHHRRKDGSIIDVEIAAHEVVFQGRQARLVLALDVTERYRAQEAVRRSEHLFSQIFHTAPIPIGISTVAEGRLVNVNEAFLRNFGYQREEIVGKLVSELNLWTEIERREQLIQELQTNGYAVGFEAKLKTRSGEIRELMISSSIVDVDNTPCSLGVSVDITERKRAEQQLLEAEKLRLEAQAERELTALKERFISGVSHEFRTPLTVIQTTISTLDLFYDRFTPDQHHERFKKIERQTKYLTALLEDVLTLSQAEAGKLTCVRSPIDVVGFCRDLFEQIQLTDTTTHHYQFVTQGEFSTVIMDAKLLQHILINLLTNAIKYSPTDTEVSLLLRRVEDQVILQIRDQGVGIPLDEQKHLFEPFFRSSTTQKIKGTGLGLTIVRESVVAHGGTVVCESEPDKGTTFTVSLPGEFMMP